ncbi:MAG: SUMF1/EgtB/PvdO family nonheme iron enzyme [Deltaproteobacteria bacterium]|nr:SUMF1/EgtB/PvdO family nonheme iron enzyme [Deltaproteobacteria bacterium]
MRVEAPAADGGVPSAAVAMGPAPPPAAATASEPREPACPPEMKLVQGEYCTEVEEHCLVAWYAPQNRKRVCEQFQPPARCIGPRIPKRFCIDTYAWPNRAGERPEVMNTFYQAQVKCAARGKRMCTESEWTFACEGPEMKPFPYGYVRDPRSCNGDHAWDHPNMKKVARRDKVELGRLWHGVPSGSQPDCISDFGVADLPGNNDEVAAGESPHAKYSSVNTGGPWYSGVRNQCRPKIYTHEEGFYYYFLGFRCCGEADGRPTEPRTPRQIREGWSFDRIERLAGFSLEQMKQVLELKREGRCSCEQNRLPGLVLHGPEWLCDTMCGTLLGPNARDGDDATRVLNPSRQKIRAP